MTRHLLPILLLPFSAFASNGTPAPADSVAPHTHTSAQILEGGLKSTQPGDSVYDMMHANAPHIFNEPDVPRFAIFGKEGKFYMGIGANIVAEGVYDFGDPLPNPVIFAPGDLSMSPRPGNGARFQFTAQQSNVYLNVVALPGTSNQLGAYVSINFVGEDYKVSLHHAYLRYRGFKAGYTHSIFTDGGAAPTTIDYAGVNAWTVATRGMIAYERTFGKNDGWRFGVGIDAPKVSYPLASTDPTVGPETYNDVHQRVPDIPFYIQRNWAGGEGWLRLSGIIRNIYYRNILNSKNVDVVGWGIKMSGKSPIVGGLSAKWQAVYGKGIASYINGFGGMQLDLCMDESGTGTMDAVKVWAAYGSLQYDFTPKLFCTATYGHVRSYMSYENPYALRYNSYKGYRYGQYVAANVFYNVNSIVQLGAEYLYGRRVNYNGLQAHDNRIEAMLKVSF